MFPCYNWKVWEDKMMASFHLIVLLMDGPPPVPSMQIWPPPPSLPLPPLFCIIGPPLSLPVCHSLQTKAFKT